MYKGRKINGKIIYHSVYANSLKECKKKLSQAKILHIQDTQGCKIYGMGTMKEYIEYWLNDIIKPNIKISTFSNYVNYAKKWIIPYFEKEKIYNIKEEKIQQFINYLTNENLSPRSVKNVYRMLKTAISCLLNKKNPT